jgi:hypothetical protein
MPIRIANLRLPLDEPETALPGYLAKIRAAGRTVLVVADSA